MLLAVGDRYEREIAATKEGKILGIRSTVLADHGAFNGVAAPTKYPAGFFGVFTGSYDIEAAYCHMTAVFTNKAPGGVAYACSFRITEAVYFVERLVEKARAVPLAFPDPRSGYLGPLIFEAQARTIQAQLDDARARLWFVDKQPRGAPGVTEDRRRGRVGRHRGVEAIADRREVRREHRLERGRAHAELDARAPPRDPAVRPRRPPRRPQHPRRAGSIANW